MGALGRNSGKHDCYRTSICGVREQSTYQLSPTGLATAKQLQELNVGDAQITNASIKTILRLHELRSRGLNSTRVDSKGAVNSKSCRICECSRFMAHTYDGKLLMGLKQNSLM